MLTAPQLRAARALLGLSIEDIASVSGLSADAIQEAEADQVHGEPEVIERLRTLLESKGVLFLGAGEEDAGAGPGVRLRQTLQDEGIRPQNLNSANDG
ncbi:DNA-binding protein [Neorhizobium lilium]|uniref:DNA-binding protein n=1 Tax=Neorhizobium lilium TaxID=2503024 RepID=A0A444LD62_9HYPH|nr:helix-turn-helix transcriptional regulator [Neorhizobium lilium]RWX75793.1 DNA-binding protein [Neorhizobium lilium]